MDPGMILAISEILRMFLRGYIEMINQSNMTEEEKQTHFDLILEEFEKFSPDKLSPAP
jgi:hypothetical protein